MSKCQKSYVCTLDFTLTTVFDVVHYNYVFEHFFRVNYFSFLISIWTRGKEVAVIYGGLPPNTKLMQAARFNDPKNPCKIMVATDAIGMGLNLYVSQ